MSPASCRAVVLGEFKKNSPGVECQPFGFGLGFTGPGEKQWGAFSVERNYTGSLLKSRSPHVGFGPTPCRFRIRLSVRQKTRISWRASSNRVSDQLDQFMLICSVFRFRSGSKIRP
jgi:hypothetical protein